MRRSTVLRSALVVIVSSAILHSQPVAVAQEATPVTAEVTRERLVETTVPAEAVPPTQVLYELWYATIEPNVEVTATAEAGACCPGPRIEHVVAGELALRVDGPLRVARSGSATAPGPTVMEEIPPGTEVVLQDGDTAVFAEELGRRYANRGADPVRLVAGGLFGGEWEGARFEGYTINNLATHYLDAPLQPGALILVLERVTLPPGAVLPGPSPGALRAVTSGPAVAYLPEASDGSISNLVKEPVVAYVFTLLPAESETGTPEATPSGYASSS